MTSVSEWTHMESSMDVMAPSSDLFDGDILGDELMDIYNAAVVGGSDDDGLNEIPSLLGPEQLTDSDQNDESMMGHPGSQVDDASGIDDGFGAFRPSTSFNDFTSLLPPADAPSATPLTTTATATAPIAVTSTTTVHYSQPIAPVVSSGSLAPLLPPEVTKSNPTMSPDGGKRKLTTSLDGPGNKKQKSVNNNSTVRKNVCATPKKKAVTGKAVNDSKKNATPNPLKTNSNPFPVRVAPVAPNLHPPKLEPVKLMTKTTAPPPVVVTPPTTTQQTTMVQTPQETPAAPAPVVSAAPPTEADFKSVAQAAVSNLIMNAGSSKTETTKAATDSSGTIDTSTEHIKALTGSNWVAVCNGGEDLPIDDCDDTVVDKMGNRARRQNLTPDERARQNRDRNREHARNTRLRKKAYVEELKRTLTALVSQRDASDLEKRHASQRELEQREVRFRVTEEFLKLRGRNETNPARWAAILEENFTLTLPVTDFREMVHSGDGHPKAVQEQVLTGVAETMRDSTMCSAFLQGVGRGQEMVSLSYNCDRKDFFMDNCTAMLEFTASTQGVVQQGASAEFALKGNIRAKFSPASNKLISIVMMFDTGVIMSQVNHIVKSSVHEVDAATAAAQHAASEADAILDSLQMPHIEPSSMPVNVVPLSSGSSTGSDGENKGLDSSDEDKEDSEFGDDSHSMPTRRVLRRND